MRTTGRGTQASRPRNWLGAGFGVHAWKRRGSVFSPDMDMQAGGHLGL